MHPRDNELSGNIVKDICYRNAVDYSGIEVEVEVAVRPENIEFLAASPTSTPPKAVNIFDAKITRATYVGELIDYQLHIHESLIRAKGDVRTKRAAGETVKIQIDPDQLSVLQG